MKSNLWIVSILFLMTACTSSKKYIELNSEKKQLDRQNAQLKRQIYSLQNLTQETTTQLLDLKKDSLSLVQNNDSLTQIISQKEQTHKSQVQTIAQLRQEIKEKDIQLAQKETNLDEQSTKVTQLRYSLNKEKKRIQNLRQTMTKALETFKSKDLKVSMKQSKVYVSLSNQLLFQSGSTEIDPKGVKAIQELAVVLNKNTDFDIRIEGHTDNAGVLEGSLYKDNWELSVLRASAIVRLLVKNKVNPKRIIASGQAEHKPLVANNSPENKSKNRRIEVILSPKVDILEHILGK